jgi:hypothetical protein
MLARRFQAVKVFLIVIARLRKLEVTVFMKVSAQIKAGASDFQAARARP